MRAEELREGAEEAKHQLRRELTQGAEEAGEALRDAGELLRKTLEDDPRDDAE